MGAGSFRAARRGCHASSKGWGAGSGWLLGAGSLGRLPL